jgi:hypothetical protein
MHATRFLLTIASLAALLATAVGCAAPLQNGGVEVLPGAEERLGVLCHFASGQRICEEPPADK